MPLSPKPAGGSASVTRLIACATPSGPKLIQGSDARSYFPPVHTVSAGTAPLQPGQAAVEARARHDALGHRRCCSGPADRRPRCWPVRRVHVDERLDFRVGVVHAGADRRAGGVRVTGGDVERCERAERPGEAGAESASITIATAVEITKRTDTVRMIAASFRAPRRYRGTLNPKLLPRGTEQKSRSGRTGWPSVARGTHARSRIARARRSMQGPPACDWRAPTCVWTRACRGAESLTRAEDDTRLSVSRRQHQREDAHYQRGRTDGLGQALELVDTFLRSTNGHPGLSRAAEEIAASDRP